MLLWLKKKNYAESAVLLDVNWWLIFLFFLFLMSNKTFLLHNCNNRKAKSKRRNIRKTMPIC